MKTSLTHFRNASTETIDTIPYTFVEPKIEHIHNDLASLEVSFPERIENILKHISPDHFSQKNKFINEQKLIEVMKEKLLHVCLSKSSQSGNPVTGFKRPHATEGLDHIYRHQYHNYLFKNKNPDIAQSHFLVSKQDPSEMIYEKRKPLPPYTFRNADSVVKISQNKLLIQVPWKLKDNLPQPQKESAHEERMNYAKSVARALIESFKEPDFFTDQHDLENRKNHWKTALNTGQIQYWTPLE